MNQSLGYATPTEAAFQSLTDEEANQLLRDLFNILEYDNNGDPGVEWNSDTTQALGEAFAQFGITFTDPHGCEAP